MSYSILSLDGGGTWALLQVRMLQVRYGNDVTGHEVLRNYDMVIANSGGSLVLASMCANMQLSKIRSIFENTQILETIFHKKVLRFSARQKKAGLREVLTDEIADKLLPDFPAFIGKPSLEIIITGFNYDAERAVYFRSNKQSMMEGANIVSAISGQPPLNPNFAAISILDAIHASSNAPIKFFNEPARGNYVINGKTTTNRLFWDGAVGGNNNPVASGVLEALANGHAREDIRVVSLGTANNIYPVLYGDTYEPTSELKVMVRKSDNNGHEVGNSDAGDVLKMATAIISDPPDAATFNANQILGLPHKQTNVRLIRINPLVKAILKNNLWTKPGKGWDDKKVKDLYELSMAVTTAKGIQLINNLFDDFVEGYFQNQGIRLGGEAIEPILGHKDFGSAMHDWKTWG